MSFTGLIAAAYTPMHDDGSLNLGRVADQAAHYRSSGIAAVFLCGPPVAPRINDE